MPVGLRWGLIFLSGAALGCTPMSANMGEWGIKDFDCGSARVSVNPQADGIDLTVLGQTYFLIPAFSDGEMRFLGEFDDLTEFWLTDDVARLTIAGQAWPECVAAGAVPEPLRARGNEPFWRLSLAGDTLSFDAMGADETESWSVEEIHSTLDERVFSDASESVQLFTDRALCRDTMTGMPYPWQVELQLGEEQLHGCGGSPEYLLQGPVWRITSLQGNPVNPDLGLTLSFLEEQRIAGHSGCNRYGGGYQLSGEGLAVGQLFSTRMACADPERSETEREFHAALEQVDRFDISDGGALQLWGGEQMLFEAEPSVP